MKKHTTKIDREIKRLKLMRDEDIDTSDIPEITDWRRAVIGKFYRPVKEPVTLRLDVDVVAWFKSKGPRYQTRINSLLREAMTAGTTYSAHSTAVCEEDPSEEAEAVSFHFPSLEKHGELEKCRNIAGLIAGRGSLFAPIP